MKDGASCLNNPATREEVLSFAHFREDPESRKCSGFELMEKSVKRQLESLLSGGGFDELYGKVPALRDIVDFLHGESLNGDVAIRSDPYRVIDVRMPRQDFCLAVMDRLFKSAE